MRTTPNAVRELAQIPDEVNLDAHLLAASDIVDDYSGLCRKADEQRLELIERYLTAHYAFLSGITTAASVNSKSIAGASTSYNRTPAGSSQYGSPYADTAVSLDRCGKLATLLLGKPSITFLG